MNNTHAPHPRTDDRVEPPELVVIGKAHTVILGTPFGGFDGKDCMTEGEFEFQKDEQ